MNKNEVFQPNNPKGHKINTNAVYSEFKDHFLIPHNNNILFSGKYGSGKSYFLKEFFEDSQIRDDFNVVTLSPVNYVVSSNEDIFELIKVDIIKSLYIDGNLDVSGVGEKIPTYKAVIKYAEKKPIQLFKNISSSLSKISVTATASGAISKAIMKLLDDFEKFEKEINAEYKTEEGELWEYLHDFVQNKSSYVESNIITEMIISHLSKIKKQNQKNNVLVIEDLDRLDPAHIFRILNIFSAHQTDDVSNKFGFDKIILVCDLKNIENVYTHFYGPETEFYGYINKFFSFTPFYFDNRTAISSHLSGVMNVNLPPAALSVVVDLAIMLMMDNRISLRKILQTNMIRSIDTKDIVCTILEKEIFYPASRNCFVTKPEILVNQNEITVLSILRVLGVLFDGYEKLELIFFSQPAKHYTLSTIDRREVENMLALNSYFIDSFDDPKKIFFSKFDEHGFRVPAMINFLSKRYNIFPKWNQLEVYNAKSSFFDGLRIVEIDSQEKKVQLDINNLLSELSRSYRFYKSKKLLLDF